MRDGVCYKIENAVANDTKSATTCVRTPVIIQFGVSYLQTGGCKVGSDYVNHMYPSFFAEYIQLDVVLRVRY